MSNYSAITNRIFIGNSRAANDKEFFKKYNIKAVLNCTKDVPNYFRNVSDIEYSRIPVDDSLKKQDFDLMENHLPFAVEYIHKHVDIQKHNILVHCWAGKQRSVITVLAYLMIINKKSKNTGISMITNKRPEAFHHGINFETSLQNMIEKRNVCK